MTDDNELLRRVKPLRNGGVKRVSVLYITSVNNKDRMNIRAGLEKALRNSDDSLYNIDDCEEICGYKPKVVVCDYKVLYDGNYAPKGIEILEAMRHHDINLNNLFLLAKEENVLQQALAAGVRGYNPEKQLEELCVAVAHCLRPDTATKHIDTKLPKRGLLSRILGR